MNISANHGYTSANSMRTRKISRNSRPSILLISTTMSTDLFSGTRMSTGRGLHHRAIVPPLGPLYVATELLDAGYAVEFIDLGVGSYAKSGLGKLVEGKDLIGISIPNTGLGRNVAQIVIDEIRSFDPHIPIVIGGKGCTLYPKILPGANVMIIGEAEHTIIEIVETILGAGDLSTCRGVFFGDKDGTVKEGLPPVHIEDLDTIKFPARCITERSKYSVLGNSLAGKATTMITTRGCPFNCRFCAVEPFKHKRYRWRSIENVIAEIETIVEDGYKYVGIMDDCFLADKQRAHAIFDEMINRNIKLAMRVEARADSADEDLYRKMREAGVRMIFFGLESGNQDTLDFYNKKTTVEQNRYAVELADRCGLYTQASFILGAPMETEAHLNRTIRFAKSLPLSSVSFNLLAYLPGSVLWSEAMKNGFINGSEPVVYATRDCGLSNFEKSYISNKITRAIREFYLRPLFWLWHIYKALIRRDKEIIRLLIGFLKTLLIDNIASRARNIFQSQMINGL